MNITRQKGCKDILPDEVKIWQYIEKNIKEICDSYNIKEIRTPVFEATELYARGVGDETDIVNKEMYTFEKSERSITLRPENTAGVVRSYIENGMSRLSSPVKLWYKGPMFRYERPQAGRQRQFHQVGVEMFGIKQPTADAEVILTAVNFLKAFPRKKRVEIVDILRGALPIPIDFKELVMIGQVLKLDKNEIYNIWEDRLKQVLESNGMNLNNNAALINAMLECSRKYIDI